MIKIASNDLLVQKEFCSLFDQKKLKVIKNKNHPYFFFLNLQVESKILRSSLDEKEKIQWSLPITFNQIFNDVYIQLSNKSIKVNNFAFFPIKQLIQHTDRIFNLSEIQNLIFTNLIMYKEQGIKKTDLIKIIWPNDKDLFINKLDTHLTNLKHQLYEQIGFNFNFSSKSGLIKLIID